MDRNQIFHRCKSQQLFFLSFFFHFAFLRESCRIILRVNHQMDDGKTHFYFRVIFTTFAT